MCLVEKNIIKSKEPDSRKKKKNLIHVEKKIDWSGKEHKPRGKEKESGEKE